MYVLVAWLLGAIALIELERRSERVRHELGPQRVDVSSTAK